MDRPADAGRPDARLVLVAGTTRTARVPGISAAGVVPDRFVAVRARLPDGSTDASGRSDAGAGRTPRREGEP